MEELIINDLFILLTFITEKEKLNRNYLRQTWLDRHKNIKSYLENRYNDSLSIKETIVRIKYNIDNRPVCPICGNPVKFRGFNENGQDKLLYSKYCSILCANKDIEYRQQKLFEQYGVINVYLLESVKNKIKLTCLEKYGVEYSSQAEQTKEKTRQTCLTQYGVTCVFKSNGIKLKSILTCLEKYGVEYSWQSENNKLKSILTCLEKYGVEYAIQSDKIKLKSKYTCLLKYGTEYTLLAEEIRNKIKKSMIEKYGGIGLGSPIIYEKYKKTMIEKYGGIGFNSPIIMNNIKSVNIYKYNSEFYINSYDFKCKSTQTNINKYGTPNVLSCPYILEKIKMTNLLKYGTENVFGNTLIKQKALNTIIERYGVLYPLQSEIIKLKMVLNNIEKYGYDYYQLSPLAKLQLSSILSSPKVQEKINNTKRKNNSFNASKPENELYEYILSYFPNAERSYKSNLYPFNCDFYIPDLDLYIEFQGSWTHGKHPFDELNQSDIELLNKWKDKNTKYYNNAILTWTIRDVNKRNIANQNNLNYKELWDLNEAKQFIDSLIKY